MHSDFTRRRFATIGVAGMLLVAGLAVAQVSDGVFTGGEKGPTFYGDVLPILESNCQVCHQPAGMNLGGMVAPMSFLRYEETRPWAPLIALAVKERRMPPWHASPAFHGKFVNERYLEKDEIETLVAWAAAGAPEGTRPPGWAPRAVSGEENGWTLGEPDLIIRFDEPFLLDDDVHDLYVNLPATITEEMLPEDRWIKSVEYRPGSPHVHHIIQRDWGGLVPGAEPRVFEGGYGRLLRKGPRTVTFNMHYNKRPGAGTGTWDHTEVGIRFMEDGEVIRYVTGGNDLMIRNFEIPPGDPAYSASMEYAFDRDVYIISFMPHMHLRGKAAQYEIYYPDGRHEVLLHVPNYDFGWQHTYEFREPVLAPEGSKLRFTVWWDNSENNPHNPDPSVSVRWGLPTYAEMAQGYMRWREVEERHIVVGQPVEEDVREAATVDDPHDAH